MKTIPFRTVLQTTADFAALDYESLTAALKRRLTRAINLRLERAWTFDRWPELTPVELRRFRPVYDHTADYSAPNATAASEVFYPATRKYYQALRATVGNAPAILTDGVWEVNEGLWHECASSYSGDDWEASTAYAVADIVRDPATGRYYACHTAHTSGADFDDAYFGILTPFQPYVALDQAGETPIGEIVRLTARDPRVFPKSPSVIPHRMGSKGVIPVGCDVVEVYVEFRLRRPVFNPEDWDTDVDYVAGDVRYLDSTGECYVALDETGGDDPSDSPGVWRKLDFPAFLAEFVEHAAAADLLRADHQNQKAAAEESAAYSHLHAARDTELEGQGVSETVSVQTYR